MMIYYVCLQRYRNTILNWLNKYDRYHRGDFKVLGYLQLAAVKKKGVVIFTDFDRLTSEYRAKAGEHCEAMIDNGYRVLNHPSKSLLRYDLQKSMRNDFAVYREDEVSRCRFPVFIRKEYEHEGSESSLIEDRVGLELALSENPGSLTVEYLDVSDEDGVFRKYSSFCIGGEIIPRHILFSKQWEVKVPKFVNSATIEEELNYITNNSHEDEVRAVFELANIQYGRIDYSFYKGKMQVWEINTNPILIVAENTEFAERKKVHQMTADRINHVFLNLDLESGGG
ncbi:MAG: hypothetical protein L3J39_02610 [Verrucomicrobiales bacterium]|nr:hypothetical protein [Verrucomicrobiales bacterium]